MNLGGHSLLATQLNVRIGERFGRKLALKDMFQAVTVEKMAALIEAEQAKPQQPAEMAIVRRARTARRGQLVGGEVHIRNQE